MYGVIWERKRQYGSCPVERGRTEEVKVAEVDGLLATWGHRDAWDWAAARVHSPAADVICVDVHGS